MSRSKPSRKTTRSSQRRSHARFHWRPKHLLAIIAALLVGGVGSQLISNSHADTVTCSRSAILVPSCGALWGFYASGNVDITPYESEFGRKFDIFRRYYSLAITTKWPSSNDLSLMSGGRIMHVDLSTKVFGASAPTSINGQSLPAPAWDLTGNASGDYYSYDQITSGQLDPLFKAIADHIKTVPHTILMDFLAEGPDTVNTTVVANYPSLNRDTLNADYKAAYQHVWNLFKQEGVTNVVWSYTVGGSQADSVYQESYPGDSYADWIMWDPYNTSASNWRSPYTVFSSFYNRVESGLLGKGAESKPFGLGEYGSTASANGNSRPQWMLDIPDALKQLPNIKSVEYYDSGSWGLFTDSSDADSAASIADFATAGKDSYVNQQMTVATPPPDTTPPSVPTNVHTTSVGTNSVGLAWSASTDDVGVAGYDIVRNGSQIATSASTSYTDTGVSSATHYSYTVKAYDAKGNTSVASTALDVETDSPSTPPSPPSGGTNPTNPGSGGTPITTVSAGTVTSKPIKAKGTIIIAPTGNTAVSVSVDGTPINGASINTNKLTNGTHTIGITENGTTKQQKIIVHNPWPTAVRNEIQAHKVAYSAGTGGGLAVIIVGLWVLRRQVSFWLLRHVRMKYLDHSGLSELLKLGLRK